MSGTSRQFQAVVTVSDRTAGPLAAISARLRAIAGMSGMQRIQAATMAVRQQFAALASSMARLAVPLGLLAGGSAVALYRITTSAADAMGELDDLQKRLGGTTQGLQAFRYAAVLAGQNGETFTAAMVRLNRGVRDAAMGRNQNLAALFQRLGISLRDSNGAIRDAADILPQLAEGFRRNENPATRTAMAMALFGRSGEALLPMFVEGAEGLNRLTDAFRRYGYAFSDEEIARGAAFGDTMDDLRLSIRGTADAIGSRLIPVLEPALRQLADWVRANRDVIASRVAEWVDRLTEALKGVDWAGVAESVRGFASAARDLFERIGGWHTTLLLVGAYMAGPLVASIAALALAITATLIPPLVRATGLLALMRAGAPLAVAGAVAAAGAANAAGAAAGNAAASAAGIAGGVALSAGALAGGAFVAADMIGRQQSQAALDRGDLSAIPSPQRNAIADFLRDNPAGGSPLLRQQSGTPAAPQGQVDVRVRLEGLPRGSQVDARATGQGLRDPQVDVGFATLGAP